MRAGRRVPLLAAVLTSAGLVSVAVGCGASGSSVTGSSAYYSVAAYTGSLPTTSATSSSQAQRPTPSTSSGRTTPSAAAISAPHGSPSRVYVFDSTGRTIVNASLRATYLDSHGVLAPPAGTAGWYAEQGWALPGQRGAAILVGHVTYNDRPDTFYNLLKVKPGNRIIVAYSSGQQVEFTADASRGVSKAQVPKDGTIWAASSKTPVLRLITCDPNTPIKGGHFEGNWVVWANPA